MALARASNLQMVQAGKVAVTELPGFGSILGLALGFRWPDTMQHPQEFVHLFRAVEHLLNGLLRGWV